MQEEIKVDNKITLRATSEETAEEKLASILASRDQLLPWLPWVHLYDGDGLENLKEYQRSKLAEFKEDKTYSYDILYDGHFAGNLEVMKISEDDHRCEIGYWLASSATGKGIMTKSVKKVIEELQDKLKMHRIEIMAAEDNKASRAVIERVGGKLEGILKDWFRLEGEYHNLAIYGIVSSKTLKR